VMVTHTMGQVRRLCNYVGVLHLGHLHFFDDVEEGIAFHQRMMREVPNAK